MAGLPYARLGDNISPESIMEDYYQRGVADINQRYRGQWDEVNKRASTLGQRRQMEMLGDIQAKSRAEFDRFHQSARNQVKELQLIDQLAKQGGFDPYEAKMRMVLGPEAEGAMFPRQTAPRSTALQFGELDVYENRLKNDAGNYLMDPGGKRIKEPLKFWFAEKKTRPLLKIWDADLDPQYDKKKKEWTSGGYRTANQEDIRRKLLIDQELEGVRRQKQELLGQPHIATRVRGAMLRVKRDPVHDSLVTRVQKAAGMEQPKPQTPPRPTRQEPERQQIQPPAEYPDAKWDGKRKMWTVVRDGRLMGVE